MCYYWIVGWIPWLFHQGSDFTWNFHWICSLCLISCCSFLHNTSKYFHFCNTILRAFGLIGLPWLYIEMSLVMGLRQNFLTRVSSGQFFVARVGSGRVSHLWFGFGFGKFPLKMSNFSIFFPSGPKKYLQVRSTGQLHFYWGSKVSSGRVRAHL